MVIDIKVNHPIQNGNEIGKRGVKFVEICTIQKVDLALKAFHIKS